MVLHHVANRSGLFVERAATLHAERFGHRDLHAGHVVAIPDGLEKRIRKAKVEQVLHRPLAEKMVDAKDVRLVEVAEQNAVERLG